MADKDRLRHKFDLVVGDQINGDGHDRHEKFTVTSTHSIEELRDAYKLGVKILEFDIQKAMNVVGGRHLTQEQIDLFAAYQAVVSELNPNWSLSPQEYVDLWIFTAKLGCRDLVANVEQQFNKCMYIGGYGLFS